MENDIFAEYREETKNAQRYVRRLFVDFERLYVGNSRWWHSLSPYHWTVKHKLFARWSEIIMDLNQMRDSTQLNAEFQTTFKGLNLEVRSNQERLKDPKKRISSVAMEDLIAIRKIWGMKDEKNYRAIIFGIVNSDNVKEDSYERILLYVMIGCTPTMLEDYKELPFSFLVETAQLLNGVGK